jgi:hypothetical protein
MKKIQKRTNWKKKYDTLHELYCKEHSSLKEALFGWRVTLAKLKYSMQIDMIISILFLIGGVTLGLIIAKYI